MAPLALAVTIGDPAGVGPELIVEAWARRKERRLPPFFVVHGREVLLAAAQARGIDIRVEPIARRDQAARVFLDALPVYGDLDADYTPGAPSRDGAKLALESLGDAAQMTVDGYAGGLVTAPISKARLVEVGFVHPGQTEYVSIACGFNAGAGTMMLAGPRLRVVPVTVHIALEDVPGSITQNAILGAAMATVPALRRDFGIARPRIAVAGLNPHAGEDGRFGSQEAEIIAPAIQTLCETGMDVRGPFPADGLFSPPALATFDAALCMYHDQALIPFKALDFEDGVNVTIGLPIVRTSPDHGTAFAIAGTGAASAGPTIAAIRLAGEIMTRRSLPPGAARG